MKILFTGRGTSGSWKIRGQQIANEMGAKAVRVASPTECRNADVIVGVKRIPDELLAAIRASGRPWVWDCVDAWPQKNGPMGKDQAMNWLHAELDRLRPTAVIWPNRKMQEDAGFGEVIYHHHRPGIEKNPIRPRIETIGYEGSPAYIEAWALDISEECRKRSMGFTINPSQLADVDVVLALRGPTRNGYPERNWKSNVKLANAHGSGTPFIGAPECGYQETASGAEYWAMSRDDLSLSLDWLESQETRQEVQRRFLASALPINAMADEYRRILGAI